MVTTLFHEGIVENSKCDMRGFTLHKTSTGQQPPPFLFAAGLIQTMARVDFASSFVLNNAVCISIDLLRFFHSLNFNLLITDLVIPYQKLSTP